MAEPARLPESPSNSRPGGLEDVEGGEAPTPAAVPEPEKTPAQREPFNHEKFKNVAAGVQSIVIAIGLLVGAGWTATTFSLLEQKAKADLDLVQSQAALGKVKAETELIRHQLKRQHIVTFELKATASGRFIIVEFSAMNTGNESVRIDWTTATFYAARVLATHVDGTVDYGPRLNLLFRYKDKQMDWLELEPGLAKSTLLAVQQVPEPGLYLVRLAAKRPAEDGGAEDSAVVFVDIK